MPRYARIHVTGGLFHVISRFHDRRYYLDIEDARATYLRLLGQASASHDARIVAYCLMSSHVHIVLQLGNDPLGALMKRVNSPFGNWVNAKRSGLGAVMADRPKSVLVHTETHGMSLVRYVHNNPVRAGVVERASESGWSSHRAYLGLEECPPWLATEAIFGGDITEHEAIRRELADYVDEGRAEGRRPDLSGEMSSKLTRRIHKLMGGEVSLSYPVLGPDSFVVESLKEQVRRHRDRTIVKNDVTVERLIEKVFEAMGLAPELARSRSRRPDIARGRALVAWLWVERLGRPQVMAAEGLMVKRAAISIMLRKMRIKKPTKSEMVLMDSVMEKITVEESRSGPVNDASTEKEPNILILKRKR